MRIGIDFDNTIVCYDQIFYEQGLKNDLISSAVPPTKIAVRKHIREHLGNDKWIFLQSIVYGESIAQAPPYDGFLDFISKSNGRKEIFIVSHKTLTTTTKPIVNLREAAMSWLDKHGICDLLPDANIYFEDSREAKIDRIKKIDCDAFIDDLLETFAHSDFPIETDRYLFDPNSHHSSVQEANIIRAWDELGFLLENKSQ